MNEDLFTGLFILCSVPTSEPEALSSGSLIKPSAEFPDTVIGKRTCWAAPMITMTERRYLK